MKGLALALFNMHRRNCILCYRSVKDRSMLPASVSVKVPVKKIPPLLSRVWPLIIRNHATFSVNEMEDTILRCSRLCLCERSAPTIIKTLLIGSLRGSDCWTQASLQDRDIIYHLQYARRWLSLVARNCYCPWFFITRLNDFFVECTCSGIVMRVQTQHRWSNSEKGLDLLVIFVDILSGGCGFSSRDPSEISQNPHGGKCFGRTQNIVTFLPKV